MKWETNTRHVAEDRHRAHCGHLYVRIEQIAAYQTPGHPDYEPPQCEWFVEPDDEDKSYRRALVTGHAATVDAAKEAATAACVQIIATMQTSLQEESSTKIVASLSVQECQEGDTAGFGSSTGLYCNHDQHRRDGGCPERLSLESTTVEQPSHEYDYEHFMPALEEAAVFLGWRVYRCVWWCPTHVIAMNLACAGCLSACPACTCRSGLRSDAVAGIVVQATEGGV